jgi:hypothetical protein
VTAKEDLLAAGARLVARQMTPFTPAGAGVSSSLGRVPLESLRFGP